MPSDSGSSAGDSGRCSYEVSVNDDTSIESHNNEDRSHDEERKVVVLNLPLIIARVVVVVLDCYSIRQVVAWSLHRSRIQSKNDHQRILRRLLVEG